MLSYYKQELFILEEAEALLCKRHNEGRYILLWNITTIYNNGPKWSPCGTPPADGHNMQAIKSVQSLHDNLCPDTEDKIASNDCIYFITPVIIAIAWSDRGFWSIQMIINCLNCFIIVVVHCERRIDWFIKKICKNRLLKNVNPHHSLLTIVLNRYFFKYAHYLFNFFLW